jgi:RNA polymerase sigma-70 factor (ECF subfamily)
MLVNDDELMSRVAHGDTDAFRFLVERWQNPLFAFFERMVGSEEDAQDLGQETFLRIYQHAKRYRPTGQFRSWLFRIAGNLARSRARRRKILQWIRFDPASHDIRTTEDSAGQDLEREAARIAVRVALDRLPQRQRQAVVLQQYEGLSYHEIADSMNITVSAVESLLHRAMVSLRKELARKKVKE